MKIYSQKWYNDQLGTCDNTIKTDGCFLVCLSMLSEISPPTANRMLKDEGGYWAGCMIWSTKAAPILGLDYKPTVYRDPGVLCVAETDHYKNQGFGQHFFIYENGKRVDPLDTAPKWETNTYHIVSYRLFSNPKPMAKEYDIKSELNTELKKRDKNFDEEKGDDHRKMAKILKAERGLMELSAKVVRTLEAEIAVLKNEEKELHKDIASLIKEKTATNKVVLKQITIISNLEEEIKKLKSEEKDYKQINAFDLGKWRFKIFTKKEDAGDDKTC